MKELKCILVTGCGGDIGQSIGKILRMEYKDVKLIGCDIHGNHASHFIFDKCEIVPRVDSPYYIEKLEEVMNKYTPDIIIPMSEAELEYFCKNNITSVNNVDLIMPNFESMRIGNDKMLTYKFLKQNKLPYPWTMSANSGKPKEFPCILKGIVGCGSKKMVVVQQKDYEKYREVGKNFMFQEYLLPSKEEYTCGVFRSKSGEIRSIIFHRVLFQGYTNYGVIVENKEISKQLETIAKKLDLIGSINVQLILTTSGTPVVFEINARFSSTVLFRHMLGFEDVIWSICDYFDEPLEEYIPCEIGTQIYKGWQEYVLYKGGMKLTIDNINFEMKSYSSV